MSLPSLSIRGSDDLGRSPVLVGIFIPRAVHHRTPPVAYSGQSVSHSGQTWQSALFSQLQESLVHQVFLIERVVFLSPEHGNQFFKILRVGELVQRFAYVNIAIHET